MAAVIMRWDDPRATDPVRVRARISDGWGTGWEELPEGEKEALVERVRQGILRNKPDKAVRYAKQAGYLAKIDLFRKRKREPVTQAREEARKKKNDLTEQERSRQVRVFVAAAAEFRVLALNYVKKHPQMEVSFRTTWLVQFCAVKEEGVKIDTIDKRQWRVRQAILSSASPALKEVLNWYVTARRPWLDAARSLLRTDIF